MREIHLLEATSNIVLCKHKLQNLLEVLRFWYLVEKEVKPPIDPKDSEKYNKKVVNVK
jgi:hypothetical protein